MDKEKAITKGSEERPPLGSEEAIGAVVEALLAARNRKKSWDFMREYLVESWPHILEMGRFINFVPHYLEVIEALRELSWVRVSAPNPPNGDRVDLDNPDVQKKYPEDYFKEYVAEVRRQEMKERRRLAARRRRGY